MKVRRNHSTDTPATSFATSENIPATLYALREYMRQHHLDGKLSEVELTSLRFRHRTPQQIADSKAGAPILSWWDAAWEIRYIRDTDRAEVEHARKVFGEKQRNKYTTFGYCEHFPVA